MDYTVKPETDAVTGLFFTCMSQRTRANDRDRATESKFYLPAGTTPSFVASRLERIWTTLFSYGIETSR
jgi:hypothetical protein